MSNFTGYNRGDALAREIRQRDEREKTDRWSGAMSCLHGVIYVSGQKHNCPACAAIKAKEAKADEDFRAKLVADARQAASQNYDKGIPLAETSVVEVETCDDDGKWVYIPRDEFLKLAPEARLITGRNKVFSSRENDFGLNYR